MALQEECVGACSATTGSPRGRDATALHRAAGSDRQPRTLQRLRTGRKSTGDGEAGDASGLESAECAEGCSVVESVTRGQRHGGTRWAERSAREQRTDSRTRAADTPRSRETTVQRKHARTEERGDSASRVGCDPPTLNAIVRMQSSPNSFHATVRAALVHQQTGGIRIFHHFRT
jgi:hypothetical protein